MTFRSILAAACTTALVIVGLGCTGPPSKSDAETSTAPDQQERSDSSRMSPGTVRVQAGVESCSTEAVPPTCRLDVTKVLGYGMSTPTISTPTAINVKTPRSEETTGESKRPVRPGRQLTLVLRHEQSIDLGEDSGARPSWQIVEVE